MRQGAAHTNRFRRGRIARWACAIARVAVSAFLLVGGCRGGYQLYWGDVHGHTALSDGTGTPDEYFRFAREEAGLDFAMLTDHDFGAGPPWWLSKADWNEIQNAAERWTEDGVFVGIAGYEWTSQAKYWEAFEGPGASEGLFDGPVMAYGHKNVYFPGRVDDIFRSNDAAYQTPDRLGAAVAREGGLIHTNHPSAGPDGADQWRYSPSSASVIVNTEIGPDELWFEGTRYEPRTERTVRAFLRAGGRAGFLGGSDTHEGRPAARTAVLARSLTRPAIFDAMRARRTYAVYGARIGLDFRINGHRMGREIEVDGPAHLSIRVRGTDRIATIKVIRNGEVLAEFRPESPDADVRYTDMTGGPESFYYVRITQADADAHGNPSQAWSSPIWVRRK